MNPERKRAILLKLRSKGFYISQQLEDYLTRSFEEFYEERIKVKEKIIDELREIENKLEEKKMPGNNQNILIELLKHKILSVEARELLSFNSLN